MCRHLGYLGPPTALETLLYLPTRSLERQSWEPQRQRHGTINADGWGVSWYDLDVRPEPARHRTDRPMWTDEPFRSIAGVVRSGCVLASVRSATPPSPVVDTGNAPFVSGPWSFAHNGAVPGWRDGLGERSRRSVSPARAAGIQGVTDSEVLFAMALDHLDAGATAASALCEVVQTVAAEAPDARLNLLLTDGHQIVATTWGDTLSWKPGTLLASEPLDDDPSWSDVADRSIVVVDRPGGDPTIAPIGRMP